MPRVLEGTQTMTSPARYRKKPVEIEAARISASLVPIGDTELEENAASIAAVSGWLLGHGCRDFKVHGDHAPFGLAIETLEGTMIASPGDWIIRGVKGEFYPCKPDIFAATYEPVDGPKP
jgi:hypothetical protein